MPAPEYDFLIIGQGLAGTLLAFTLIERGHRVMVLDNNHIGCSTQVAAGIINPITGHRLNLTERFNEFYPIAKSTYKKLERSLGVSLFKEISQCRLIKNAGQNEYLQKRLLDPMYTELLRESASHPYTTSQFGSIHIGSTAVVNTKALLKSGRIWLESIDSFQNLAFDYECVQFGPNAITAAGISASSVIFCEGYQAINNPWLKDLPFKLAKGEVLTVEAEQAGPDQMLNWGSWLLFDNDMFAKQARLGASYGWSDTSLTRDADTASALMTSLEKHTNIATKVIDHEVGIRPTTVQRKPFVGPLSELARAHCFNGFGSKGCLLGPYYAELLCTHMIDGTPLPHEVTRWL